MNKSRIEEIIGIAEKWDLDALEVEDDKGAVRVVRRSGGSVAPAPPAPKPEATPQAKQQDIPDGARQVTSPMVGIFTTQPYEEDTSPVLAGDTVTQGQPLGYLEAMKMVTTVEAPCNGKLLEIQAADGQSVQFGEPLFLIQQDPDGA